MKILGAVLPLELPAKHHCQSSPFISNWPNRQYYLAGRSKTAPSILIFSIALDADYSSYVKSIATFALIFFWVYYFSHSQCGAVHITTTSEDRVTLS